MRLHVEIDGAAGRLEVVSVEPGKDPAIDHFRVITARIEQLDYASLTPVSDAETDEPPAWMLARYALRSSGVLTVEIEDTDIFDAAVKNGDLPGEVKKERSHEIRT